MMKVEFLRKYIISREDEEDEEDEENEENYEFLLDGKPYMYDKTNDTIMYYIPWHTIRRLDLRINILEAFNKAWNPVYTDARTKPEGEPVAIRDKRVGTSDEYYETVFNHVRPTLNEWGQQHRQCYTVAECDENLWDSL